MTPDDPLERELESLRPRLPSPELRLRIGNQIARPWRLRFTPAVAAATAAAALIVLAVGHRPPPNPVVPPMAPPRAETVTVPTVLAYERAFARSPADLDALLDEQAVRTSRNVAPAQAGVAMGILALKGS